MQVIDPIGSGGATGVNRVTTDASSAFGVGFEDLLRIVLTQLTYQDPLQPMENFEFVSQLAQFSQIQQTETTNENLEGIRQIGTVGQATGLLGQVVDIPSGGTVLRGRVTAVSFVSGAPSVSIETQDGTVINSISLSAISRVAEGGTQ
ncbi:flagellar hook assembly protein FlgD [Maricaulis sp. D1M11]|uniref:flagellar hook assembly protein FlgD n=1 Tax=Maricaulis sp. D1M11 TaxID=3076117 RepID=UPI0039B4EF20